MEVKVKWREAEGGFFTISSQLNYKDYRPFLDGSLNKSRFNELCLRQKEEEEGHCGLQFFIAEVTHGTMMYLVVVSGSNKGVGGGGGYGGVECHDDGEADDLRGLRSVADNKLRPDGCRQLQGLVFAVTGGAKIPGKDGVVGMVVGTGKNGNPVPVGGDVGIGNEGDWSVGIGKLPMFGSPGMFKRRRAMVASRLLERVRATRKHRMTSLLLDAISFVLCRL
ncbi:hypothetical protein L6452_01264 [Arctium lappa]|uniref:Uncharacterized protein n=1 Tax=Arctium lappa TaxID=4217 RepID=A0ACB9FHN1_ARCLA|nr:hypothetical protein L6452_01264 [Arctium lappa]